MRRLALALAGLCGALALAFVVLVARAPLAGVDAAVLAALREGSGLTIAVNGRAAVTWFPTVEIRIDGVSAARGDETPFALAREVVARPRLGALLAGRVELAGVTLREPQIALDRIPFDEVFAALRAAPARSNMPELRVVDGRLAIDGRSIEGVTGALVWPSAGRPLAVSAYGTFEGRPVEGAASLADPEALARGARAPVRARLTGGGARVLFDGHALDAEGPRFEGALRMRAASLRQTLRWLGAPAPRRSAPLTGFSLAGEATADRHGLSIANAELDLEDHSFLGAGRLTTGGKRPSVEATLDAETLDLAPYVDGLAPGVRENGALSSKRFDLAAIQGFDLDLRLSAGTLTFAGFRFEDVAATVAIADGALDISVGEASAYGGAVSGRLIVEPRAQDAVALRADLSATDVTIEEAFAGGGKEPPIAGALTAEFGVRGEGRSAAEIVGGLEGRGRLRLADGAIKGFGHNRALALVGLRGALAVSSAEANVVVRRGVALTQDLKAVGSDATLTLAGDARLAAGELKLDGFVRPVEGGWRLPIRVDGPFAAPRIRPNISLADPQGEARNMGAR
jgi:AsmA protein